MFDLESDALLDEITCLHSLVLWDLDEKQLLSFADEPGYRPLAEGIDLLMEADLLVGHNILKFDLPSIEAVTGCVYRGKVFDTLTVSRLIWTDLADRDFRLAKRHKVSQFPAALTGMHGLEAWGYRLKVYKGDFGKTSDWSHWSKEMQVYCEKDVEVTLALYERILQENYSEEAIELEHDFQRVIFKQEQYGFPFNVKAAESLSVELKAKAEELTKRLREVFPDRVEVMKTPAYWTARKGSLSVVGANKGETESMVKGSYGSLKGWVLEKGPMTERKHPFNPGSRLEVAKRLRELGWEPTEFTDTGQDKIDEDTLANTSIPEAKLVAEYFMLEKRLGQLSEGSKAWLKLQRNGRIHGGVTTNGAVTGRCTHQRPNVSQTPSVRAPYGRECRALFTADEGYSLVGADASGLELRCLGHYLSPWDGGDYGREVVSGDIHTRNQQLAGLPTRDDAKTFIYALLYGAGDEKLGSIIGGGAAAGAKLRKRFMDGLPAYAKLVTAVKHRTKEKGYLIGLDGRRINVRSPHSALNTLLQGAGAIIVKKGTVLLYRHCLEKWEWGKDFANVVHNHDEVQINARPDIAEEIGKLAVASFTEAGESFGFRVPITGTYSIGSTWAETH